MIKGRIIIDMSHTEHICCGCKSRLKDDGKINVTGTNGHNQYYCFKCFKKILEIELSKEINESKRTQYDYILELMKLNS